MQAINGIQNAMINTNTGTQSGMVVESANAHRTYLPNGRPCEVRPVSMQPDLGVSRSESFTDGAVDLKQRLQDTNGIDSGNGPQTMCSGRQWRIDNRHLPEAAWAMLVLSRSLCG